MRKYLISLIEVEKIYLLIKHVSKIIKEIDNLKAKKTRYYNKLLWYNLKSLKNPYLLHYVIFIKFNTISTISSMYSS
jgi:hypothetical protein